MRRELVATLIVPDGKKVSVLEWMRTPVTQAVGHGDVRGVRPVGVRAGDSGTGAVDCGAVAPVKMTELARYGVHAKAPRSRS